MNVTHDYVFFTLNETSISHAFFYKMGQKKEIGRKRGRKQAEKETEKVNSSQCIIKEKLLYSSYILQNMLLRQDRGVGCLRPLPPLFKERMSMQRPTGSQPFLAVSQKSVRNNRDLPKRTGWDRSPEKRGQDSWTIAPRSDSFRKASSKGEEKRQGH